MSSNIGAALVIRKRQCTPFNDPLSHPYLSFSCSCGGLCLPTLPHSPVSLPKLDWPVSRLYQSRIPLTISQANRGCAHHHPSVVQRVLPNCMPVLQDKRLRRLRGDSQAFHFHCSLLCVLGLFPCMKRRLLTKRAKNRITCTFSPMSFALV
jgi:hypothetical protein